ncbi:hypothetical protein RZR22_17635, partial [Escherichia coli]|uniref:hypothetical protein n=1 Tax=Escherichia coli TaxID=562 RepID=UPI00292B4EB6
CVHHIWCPLFSQEFQDLPDGAETTLTDKVRHLHDDNGSEPIESLPLLMPTNRGKGPLKELSDNSSEIIQSLPLSA